MCSSLSHSNVSAAMVESGEIRYIPPNKCLTRQAELAGDKPDKMLKLDLAQNQLVVKDHPKDRETDVTSDLSLYQAMTRRALATDLVGFASYGTVMKFVNRLFNLLNQQPAAGFMKPSTSQLLRADRQCFMRLAEMVAPPFTVNAAGTLPVDLAFDQLHNDVTITYHMLPVPAPKKAEEVRHLKGMWQTRRWAPSPRTPTLNPAPKGKASSPTDVNLCLML